MLDKHTQKVLSYINSQCKDGSYKVITAEDLISLFNKKYKPAPNDIALFIENLKHKKLIVVKYKDDSSYLVTATNSGKNFSFNQEPLDIKLQKRHILFFIATSLASAILGGIIAGLFIKFFG